MKTISQKKFMFLRKNSLGHFFSRFNEYGRPQVTFCKAPEGYMAIIVQVVISFP